MLMVPLRDLKFMVIDHVEIGKTFVGESWGDGKFKDITNSNSSFTLSDGAVFPFEDDRYAFVLEKNRMTKDMNLAFHPSFLDDVFAALEVFRSRSDKLLQLVPEVNIGLSEVHLVINQLYSPIKNTLSKSRSAHPGNQDQRLIPWSPYHDLDLNAVDAVSLLYNCFRDKDIFEGLGWKFMAKEGYLTKERFNDMQSWSVRRDLAILDTAFLEVENQCREEIDPDEWAEEYEDFVIESQDFEEDCWDGIQALDDSWLSSDPPQVSSYLNSNNMDVFDAQTEDIGRNHMAAFINLAATTRDKSCEVRGLNSDCQLVVTLPWENFPHGVETTSYHPFGTHKAWNQVVYTTDGSEETGTSASEETTVENPTKDDGKAGIDNRAPKRPQVDDTEQMPTLVGIGTEISVKLHSAFSELHSRLRKAIRTVGLLSQANINESDKDALEKRLRRLISRKDAWANGGQVLERVLKNRRPTGLDEIICLNLITGAMLNAIIDDSDRHKLLKESFLDDLSHWRRCIDQIGSRPVYDELVKAIWGQLLDPEREGLIEPHIEGLELLLSDFAISVRSDKFPIGKRLRHHIFHKFGIIDGSEEHITIAPYSSKTSPDLYQELQPRWWDIIDTSEKPLLSKEKKGFKLPTLPSAAARGHYPPKYSTTVSRRLLETDEEIQDGIGDKIKDGGKHSTKDGLGDIILILLEGIVAILGLFFSAYLGCQIYPSKLLGNQKGFISDMVSKHIFDPLFGLVNGIEPHASLVYQAKQRAKTSEHETVFHLSAWLIVHAKQMLEFSAFRMFKNHVEGCVKTYMSAISTHVAMERRLCITSYIGYLGEVLQSMLESKSINSSPKKTSSALKPAKTQITDPIYTCAVFESFLRDVDALQQPVLESEPVKASQYIDPQKLRLPAPETAVEAPVHMKDEAQSAVESPVFQNPSPKEQVTISPLEKPKRKRLTVISQFKCPECFNRIKKEKFSSTRQYLNRHRREAHNIIVDGRAPTKSTPCSKCFKTFTREAYRILHEETKCGVKKARVV